MSQPVAVIRQTTHGGTGERIGAQVYVWCPGCDDVHGIGVTGDDGSHPRVEWTWDGSLEAPTFAPSILVRMEFTDGRAPHVCHSYLEAGRWRYLSDSTHAFAGVTDVPMVPLPDWLVRP
jgi:hypothetical protein